MAGSNAIPVAILRDLPFRACANNGFRQSLLGPIAHRAIGEKLRACVGRYSGFSCWQCSFASEGKMALVNPFRPQICDNAVQGLLESREIFVATHRFFSSNVNNSLISIFQTRD